MGLCSRREPNKLYTRRSAVDMEFNTFLAHDDMRKHRLFGSYKCCFVVVICDDDILFTVIEIAEDCPAVLIKDLLRAHIVTL